MSARLQWAYIPATVGQVPDSVGTGNSYKNEEVLSDSRRVGGWNQPTTGGCEEAMIKNGSQ